MNFMKTESLPYEYTEKDAQYKGIDMSQKHVVVDAQYIDTGQFTGNRFLEALPPITSDHSSINNLFTRIPSMPSWDALEKMDPILRDVVLDNIMDVRFPLPYHRQLKKELYRLICSSYCKREESTRYNEVQVQDKTYTTNTSLLAHPQGEAINGLAVIGPSGTGKSSSINLMLQHFPQVVIHNDGGRKIVQIVYLFVTCPELSNFNALYESIAKAVDDALNNGLELYKNQMNKIKGLGAKSLYVRQLIEGFGIGLIVLDEIQQIDLKSTKENSIEALLRLNNDTHVGFVVAGLPEAFKDLFHKPHTRGRFPYHLETGDYCKALDQIRNIIEMLFVVFDFCNGAYQVDEEMVKIFYQESNGCVKFIDMMFECVVKDYLNRRKEDRPGVIDAAYVRTVAEKYDITTRAEMMKKTPLTLPISVG